MKCSTTSPQAALQHSWRLLLCRSWRSLVPCSLATLWRARSTSAYLPCAPALTSMLAASASHAWCADLLHDRHALHGGRPVKWQWRRLPRRTAHKRSALRRYGWRLRRFACSCQDRARFRFQLQPCLVAECTCKLCAAAAAPPIGRSLDKMRWQSRAAWRMRAASSGPRGSSSATCSAKLCSLRKLRSIFSFALTWRRAQCAGAAFMLRRCWCHHQAALLPRHPLLQPCPELP